MKLKSLIIVILAICASLPALANEEIYEDYLLGDFLGLRPYLADIGIEMDAGVTQIYQNNVRGGLSTSNNRGRYSGSYDIELNIDAEKIFGFEGGSFYIHAEGSWTDTEGIDATSVGSFFGVNGDAAGDRALDVTELFYEQTLANDYDLLLRVGKMDISGGFECRGCPVAFDSSLFANDETAQFLNAALANNPTIPFPDKGLAVSLFYSPADTGCYLAGAVADAQADARETGFNTAFNGQGYFFYIAEAGFTVSPDTPGTYRLGLWYDPQPKAHSDTSDTETDDMGFYISCDQTLTRENDEDSQGLGAFFRYGYAPSRTNDLSIFYSAGLQYQGLFEGRDDDVLGFGFAQGDFSDKADTTYTDDHEQVYEIYYNAQVASAINVTPSLQYVVDPGANDTASDAVVLGLRVQMAF